MPLYLLLNQMETGEKVQNQQLHEHDIIADLMDPVTHGLTGALLAEAGFQQRLGGRCRLALTAASMFPDIDIIYRIEGLPAYIANHRALTHSFIGILLSGVLLGAIFGRWDEERRYVAWISACWVALFSHQVLDLITSYGTVLLYPFNHTRFYFDWVFIIDFVLSGIVLLFLILSRIRPDAAAKRAKIGLLVAAAYVGFCAANHSLALHQLRNGARDNGISFAAIAAIPQPISPFRWAGILDVGPHYYRVPIRSYRPPEASDFQAFAKAYGSIYEQTARSSEMGVLYFWFARYPVVQEKIQGNAHILEFYDLRFYRAPVYRYFLRTPFVLRIKVDEAGNILESSFSRL